MRIGIICCAWGEKHRGGLETHVSGLAKLLTERGHHVFIHCIDSDINNKHQYKSSGWNEGKIHIEQTNYNYTDTRCLLDYQCVPQAEIALEHWIKRNNLDLVDFHHNLFFGMRAIQSCSKLIPTVATLHDYWCIDPQCALFGSDHSIINPNDHAKWENNSKIASDRTFKSIDSAAYYRSPQLMGDMHNARISLKTAWTRYSNEMLSHANMIITPSREAKTILHQHGITHQIHVVENGLNLSYPRGQLIHEVEINTHRERHKPRIRIGILGSVAPHKGQLQFCEALLQQNLQNFFKVDIYGPIPENYQGNQSSQIQIKKLASDLPDFLTLKGSYDRKTLPSIFSNLDIVAMPSLWHEVYGFTAREALAYGLPISVTDAGGLKSLSGHEGVLTLPMADSNHWGECIKKELEEGPLFKWTYQRRQRIPMPSDFIPSNQDCARSIEAIYQHLLAPKSKKT